MKMKKYFGSGKIVGWANDGEILVYDSITEVAERIYFTEKEIKSALGTDKELGGVTYFRYGADKEATKAFDDAMSEAELTERSRRSKMLRIKEGRMNELEGFGFKREDSAYRYKNTLLIPDWENKELPNDRKIGIQFQKYGVKDIEEMLGKVYELSKADMIEEVTECHRFGGGNA